MHSTIFIHLRIVLDNILVKYGTGNGQRKPHN